MKVVGRTSTSNVRKTVCRQSFVKVDLKIVSARGENLPWLLITTKTTRFLLGIPTKPFVGSPIPSNTIKSQFRRTLL